MSISTRIPIPNPEPSRNRTDSRYPNPVRYGIGTTKYGVKKSGPRIRDGIGTKSGNSRNKREKPDFPGTGTDIRIPFGTGSVPLIYGREKIGTTNSGRDRDGIGTVLIPSCT